jgi:hypothetical protein
LQRVRIRHLQAAYPNHASLIYSSSLACQALAMTLALPPVRSPLLTAAHHGHAVRQGGQGAALDQAHQPQNHRRPHQRLQVGAGTPQLVDISCRIRVFLVTQFTKPVRFATSGNMQPQRPHFNVNPFGVMSVTGRTLVLMSWRLTRSTPRRLTASQALSHGPTQAAPAARAALPAALTRVEG